MMLFIGFVRDEAGQDLIEYSLLAALIAVVCVIAIEQAGSKVSELFVKVNESIP